MSETAGEPAAVPPNFHADLPAIAAFGAWSHTANAVQVLTDWMAMDEEGRAKWRAVADAVRMANEAQP